MSDTSKVVEGQLVVHSEQMKKTVFTEHPVTASNHSLTHTTAIPTTPTVLLRELHMCWTYVMKTFVSLVHGVGIIIIILIL